MDSYSAFSDSELAGLLRDGKESAFSEIFRRYHGPLFLHALKMLQDDEQAKDIVQEMFAVLWAKHTEVNVRGSLEGYLFTAVKNRILDHFAHQKVVDKYTDSLNSFIEAGEIAVDDVLIAKQLKALIEKEIALLPAKMREIFELSRMEGLSHKQIAEKLRITEHTIKSQLSNAAKILGPRIKLNVIFFLYF